MKKNLILSLVFAFAIIGISPAVSAVHENQGLEDHCPSHEGHPGKVNNPAFPSTTPLTVDGVEVNVNVSADGKSVNFTDENGDPINVEFCIKAADLAGGKQTGTSGNVTWVNHGGQIPAISYVLVYSVVEAEEPEEPETPVTPETPRTPITPSSTDVEEEEEVQVEAPVAGVNAGSGDAATIATAVVTLVGSLASLAYGVVRFTKFSA